LGCSFLGAIDASRRVLTTNNVRRRILTIFDDIDWDRASMRGRFFNGMKHPGSEGRLNLRVIAQNYPSGSEMPGSF
jgi:hypothetical protein